MFDVWRAFKILVITVVCFLLSMSGCHIPIAGEGANPPAPYIEGQAEAEPIVWSTAFGAGHLNPPPVVWMHDAACTDAAGKTWERAFRCDGDCCTGYYDPWRDVAYVEYPLSGKVSDSTYAHELCHAWLNYTGRDWDYYHNGQCYRGLDKTYETLGSMVGNAHQLLIDAGL